MKKTSEQPSDPQKRFFCREATKNPTEKQSKPKLPPRSSGIFTIPFIIQLLFTSFCCLLLGALLFK